MILTGRTSVTTTLTGRDPILTISMLKINTTDFLLINGTDRLIISTQIGTQLVGRIIPT